MKAAVAALTLVLALSASVAQAAPHHHCYWRHHHRVCHR